MKAQPEISRRKYFESLMNMHIKGKDRSKAKQRKNKRRNSNGH